MDQQTSTSRRGEGEISPLVELVDEKDEKDWVEVENDEYEERDEGINYLHDKFGCDDYDNDNPYGYYGNYPFGDDSNENDNKACDDGMRFEKMMMMMMDSKHKIS